MRRLPPRLRGAPLTPEAGVVAICVLFVAISAWWLAEDVRMVNTDNAKHLLISARWHDTIRAGDWTDVFTEWAQYPFGVHLVGALGIALGGLSVFSMVFAENLVFVPLLALGCYGTARIVFGRTAGLLAVLFAFAAPMVMSMFHVFMLDIPEAAMVAVTVWLLIASDRFSKWQIAAAAGAVAGLGMYTKGTFVLFIAGIVAMLFLRGGWRNWKGWLAFGTLFVGIAGPWYLDHLDDLRGQTTGAVGGGPAGTPSTPLWYDTVHFPEHGSIANFTWYGWNLVNHQLYLPLTLFALAGAGWAVWRVVRDRGRDSYLPELLAGCFVGYLGASWIVLKDPRYTLPCLVYLAVISTAWIVAMPRKPRLLATGVLVGLFVLNTLNHNFGVGGVHTINTAKTVPSPLGEYSLKIVNANGYFEGGPSKSAQPFVDLLDRSYPRGVRSVIVDEESFTGPGYGIGATTLLVTRTKLALPGFTADLVTSDSDAWIIRVPVAGARYRPCIASLVEGDGTGIYLFRGRAPKRPERVKPDCP